MITRKMLCSLALVAACAGLSCVSNRPSRNGVFNENQYVRKDFLVRSGATQQPVNSQCDTANGWTLDTTTNLCTKSDPGWFMQVTITSTSTPNPLANVSGSFLAAGTQSSNWGQSLVRFVVNQDKLDLVDMRELTSDAEVLAQGTRNPSVLNAWSTTNVDLKYRINLDGETTNFYEENQERPWQERQWVKLNFAKNDLSDLAPFYAEFDPILMHCTDKTEYTASSIPNSLLVDEKNGYMEFGVQLTIPISFDAEDTAACMEAFGPAGANFFRMARSTVTLNLLYSFVRADKVPTTEGYVPLELAEKDPIRHKYGAIDIVAPYRDQNTGLMGAKQFVTRHNPNKDIVWYFAKGLPEVYKSYFVQPGGIVDSTNAVLAKTGGTGRLVMLNYDDDKTYGDALRTKEPATYGTPRKYGDIRYNFIVWHSDYDTGTGGLLGVTQLLPDPRTGQLISTSINITNYPLKDAFFQRLDFFLQETGSSVMNAEGTEFSTDPSLYPEPCTDGDIKPLVDEKIANEINARSTVYGKMQAFLQKPVSQYGYLGPANFVAVQDKDFFNAYYAVLPYTTYADPQANDFVTPSGEIFTNTAAEKWNYLKKVGEFNDLAAKIDHGQKPWDIDSDNGVAAGLAFNHKFTDLTQQVYNYEHFKVRQRVARLADDIGLFSYLDMYKQNGRKCVNRKWETRSEYVNRLVNGAWAVVTAHEFGHAMGLEHNFYGSVDQRNYPTDTPGCNGTCGGCPTGTACAPTLYSSSIMDYNNMLNEAIYMKVGRSNWAPYDAAALGWIYGNNLSNDKKGPQPVGNLVAKNISGQVSATAPWSDPIGFNGDTETNFLYCTNKHVHYTPLCRMHDAGITPSQITANELQRREWEYRWTNFRLYHKYFDLGSYPQRVVTDFAEYRRFLTMWSFDWSAGELTNILRLVGVTPPAGTTAGEYYSQLTDKFNKELSWANQLGASYHRAIIDQNSGERPYITVFDPFYGDTTQQGIQLDKMVAVAAFSSLWPAIENYDPSQAGAYMITNAVGNDSAYNSVAESVLLDFLGANFATYTYAQIGPILAFSEAVHSSMWPSGPHSMEMQQWMGGYVFDRERDFMDFIHAIAVKYQFKNCDENGLNCDPCTSIDHCSWDPRVYSVKDGNITQSDRYNRFQAPDGRTYIWSYLKARNKWVLADKDRNVGLYTLILNWASLVVNSEDDGHDGAQYYEMKVRYAIDAFKYFSDNQIYAP